MLCMIIMFVHAEERKETSLEFFERRRAEMMADMRKNGIAFNNKTVGGPAGIHGVDLSQPCSKAGFQCLRNNGFRYAIVRCFLSTGHVDSNCPASLGHAWEGGMAHVDAYLFPCPHCSSSGATQVKEMVNFIRSHGGKFGMIWLDVEGAQYWHSSSSQNRAFFLSLVEGAHEAGVHVGVYAQKWFWEQTFGGNWDVSKYKMPIWYAHYDNNPSYSDWSPFGGWHSPSMKQYHGTTNICSCGIDKNVY
eukprot:CAMPEP_0117426674 /NCGR_PEP_ID=MMETSP0758-20121206/6719_1 /TAXON_ID=63605 /ORGANISM="Percolomonas cosmopolitus, Strain AE-1 (ATCC 50343)" /LENGTH=246 /DNA_ID=CAMNT_0005211941 /DNA_START=26 /DNA_END=766 /DNA_ORIENTATION=+